MGFFYQTNLTVTGESGSAVEAVEIRNPSASNLEIHLVGFTVTSEAGFSIFTLRRYDGLPAHSGAVQGDVYPWRTDGPSPAGEVYTGASGEIDWSGLTVTLLEDVNLDPSDAGDDRERRPGMYLDPRNQMVILPGESASIALPEGLNTFIIGILWEERQVQPIDHAAAATLPAAGAWTAGSFQLLDPAWRSIAFAVDYTAQAATTTARPKARATWRDADGNEMPTPVAETSLDTSSAPEAVRVQHHLVDTIPVVPATETRTHVFLYDVPTGAVDVRIDLAEAGQTALPGTASARMTGAP